MSTVTVFAGKPGARAGTTTWTLSEAPAPIVLRSSSVSPLRMPVAPILSIGSSCTSPFQSA
eukprot:6590061-Prymnesium_polylepis.1